VSIKGSLIAMILALSAFFSEGRAEDKTADSAEAVDADFDV